MDDHSQTFETVAVAPWTCPRCGVLLNGRMSEQGEAPRPGDISFCLHCLGMMIYYTDADRQVVWRAATDDETAEFLTTPFGRSAYDQTRLMRQWHLDIESGRRLRRSDHIGNA